MATEPAMLRRRDLLALAASVACPPVFATTGPGRLLAAWERDARYEAGLLEPRQGRLHVVEALELPTRAHGLLRQADGHLLAVARRPGDWIVRWQPGAAAAARWHWIEDGTHLNGHACFSGDGRWLYTAETGLEHGEGRIGVRDAASLEKVQEWPTHGSDPHALLLDARGDLWVANGGIRTAPETGRAKLDLEHMDSSLVCIAGAGGALQGKWQVEDTRLSLRHLAWGSWQGRPALGIAMQAQHATEAARHAAPVLAVWQPGGVRPIAAAAGLAGYGGDIAYARGSFAVSCPRADGVALFGAAARGRTFIALADACALAGEPPWAGGSAAAAAWPGGGERVAVDGLRLDNHWLVA